jgi:radical SAM enzyme (rSAM/lipoprotein system)
MMKKVTGIGLRRRLALEVARKMENERIAQHELHQLFWECTLRCNLHCRHCGSDCHQTAAEHDMPLDDFLHVLDNVRATADPHKVFVILTGGEPLMRPDLEQCGRAIYSRGFPWGMVTNGLGLTRKRFEALRSAGLHTMTISLDGLRDEHNWMRGNPTSYDHAVESIKMLVETQTTHGKSSSEEGTNRLAENALPVIFDVVTCANQRNYDKLDELKEMLIGLGVRRWRIFTVFPVGRAVQTPELQLDGQQFRGLMDFIRRTRHEGRIALNYGCEGFLGSYEGEVRDNFYSCQAGVSVASVLCDGSISACPSIRADYHQGNIYRDNFMDVWQERFKPYRYREWMRTGDCADCRFFRYCRGGGMHLRDSEGKLLFCHLKRLSD